MCSIDPDSTPPPAGTSGKPSTTATATTAGGTREQLVIFLADVLRGTAEERAPIVMAMSQQGAGGSKVVTRDQVAEVSSR